MPARVRVLVRTRAEWREMSRSNFQGQSDPTRPLKWVRSDRAAQAVDLWGEAFALDFFTYRAELRDIAFSSIIAAHPDVVTVGFDDFGIDGFEGWLADPQEEFVVALDDDD